MNTKFEAHLHALEISATARLDEVLAFLERHGVTTHKIAPPSGTQGLVGYWRSIPPGVVLITFLMDRQALQTLLTVELWLDDSMKNLITLVFDHPNATGGRMVTNCPRERLPEAIRNFFLAAEWEPVTTITWADVSMIVDAYLEMMRPSVAATQSV